MGIRTTNLERSLVIDELIGNVTDDGVQKTARLPLEALANQLAGTGPFIFGNTVYALTKAALEAFSPPNEQMGGVVLNDPNAANNGYYARSGAAWLRGRGFPDSFALFTQIGGTANALQVAKAAAVDPAGIVAAILVPTGTNTGPTTISISGAAAVPLLSAAGSPLGAAELVAGKATIIALVDGNWRVILAYSQFTFRGTWAAPVSYIADDLAEHGGSLWLALRPNTGVAPAEGADWTLFLPGVSVADGSVGWEKLSPLAQNRTSGFPTVTALLADTSLSYSNVAAGNIIEAQGFRYEVAAPGASDHHVTTAGGVKLYVLPGVKGYPAPAFGAIGDGTVSRADMLTRCTTLWNAALANAVDMYFPDGFYEIGDAAFPWRQQVVSGLLDCKNITLHADGPQTIFATYTPDGADVFQLNGIKNFNVVGFPTLTSTLTGFAGAGSNACSVTNGFDNLYLELTCTDLPRVDKTTYIDGGKGLTIQPSNTVNECGKLTARIRAKGCSYAFGADLVLNTMDDKRMSVVVDIEAEDCYRWTSIAAGAATAALSADFDLGISVRGHAINCQQDVRLNRVHGCRIDCTVVTTKTAAERRLAPDGAAWIASDAVVEALHADYVRNGAIRLAGNKGDCDYKARIGGASAGSSGLTGRTLGSSFDLDLGGIATSGDVVAINSGGNISANSVFVISQRTTSEAGVDALLKNSAYGNLFDFAGTLRMVNPKVADALLFAFTADGVTETGRIDLFGLITGLQGEGASTAGAVVTGLYDQGGVFRLGVRNGNGIVLDALGTSAAIGTYIGKQPVYTSAGTLIGYFPIYN